jgi:hypothetical protein
VVTKTRHRLRHERQDGLRPSSSEVEDRVKHSPLQQEFIRRTSKVKAHDEANAAGIGDLVLISRQTIPLAPD